jgi:tetratricopeptide (TPR) repeat protein
MIPEVSIYNPIVLLSIAVHIYLLYIASKEFNKRSFLSFGILFYFIAIFPFANTFFPLTGVIAERMLFVPSIGFAIAMVDIVFRISKINMNVLLSKSKRNTAILLLGLIILPNFLITLNRNKDWKDRKTLFEHDLKYLENSAKANTLYANLIIAEVYEGIKKNIPIDNFKNQINLSVKHYNRSIEIDSTYSNPWHNLGYLNMLVFKNYKLAEEQFSNCLKNDTTLAPAYLNRGICNYYLGNFKQSIKDLKDYLTKNNNYKNKEKDKAYVFMGKSYFELGDTAKARQYYIKALDNLKMENLSKPVIDDFKTLFLKLKDYNNLIRVADIEISLNPELDVPYVDKGNYYLLMGDTINAIAQWEIAFDKYKGNFNIGMTLSGYYRDKGDFEKANYYYLTAIKNKRN